MSRYATTASTLLFFAALISSPISFVTGAIAKLEQCREWGFDPFDLSCETCNLLPETDNAGMQLKLKLNCEQCCQSFKTTSKGTRRYGHAVLVRGNDDERGGEIADFLGEDVTKVTDEKGNCFEVITSPSLGAYYRMPAQLFLFDEKPASYNQNDLTKAKERIVLDGWKRDDLKDMLLALLPDK